jgi:hypothetical protein
MEQILRRDDECCTVAEVAERFKVNEETIRGSSCPKPVSSSSVTLAKGRRQYRTLRIPKHVVLLVLTRFARPL